MEPIFFVLIALCLVLITYFIIKRKSSNSNNNTSIDDSKDILEFEKIKVKYRKDKFEINFHHLKIHKIGNYFAEVKEGQPCALFGSTEFLEICLNKKNASQVLRAGKKDKVWIVFQ